ncbi:hypothetical protein ACROYT_G039506 [Oculina patagonica]
MLIRILKRQNQLHLFRRLEQCSIKQVSCETAIEFLKLCKNLDLTPTFAKVDRTKAAKWKGTAKAFEENVIAEELRQKAKRMTELREEINEIYDEIREKCLPLRFACILRTIVILRNEKYAELMNGHTKKISRLLYNNTDVDEHITNLSSYRLSFYQKLVLCRGLDFALPQLNKGSGIVVMDKTDYVHLLKEASINDESKFIPVQLERPKTRKRPPKHYHPLLRKEKELTSIVRRILPKQIADLVIQKGSRLAHLYGLPKTHKKQLAVRPILSATGTYNYKLTKWLDEKLKPLSLNTNNNNVSHKKHILLDL